VNVDFATGAVCYPNIEYPKVGYTVVQGTMVKPRTEERLECPVCGGRGTTRGRAAGRTGGTRYRCPLCGTCLTMGGCGAGHESVELEPAPAI